MTCPTYKQIGDHLISLCVVLISVLALFALIHLSSIYWFDINVDANESENKDRIMFLVAMFFIGVGNGIYCFYSLYFKTLNFLKTRIK